MFHQLMQHGIYNLLFLVPIVLAGGPPTQVPTREPGPVSAVPERAVVIRLSESLFQPPDGGKFDHASDVNRTVLGNAVSGTSKTYGRTRVDLVPDENDGSFKLVLNGVSYSRTSTRNGPATIHNSATTQFQCVKRITFDLKDGFLASPSEAKATTQITNDGISTKRSGLIGRVVRTVATRRVQESQAEATSISNRDTQRDVSHGFDAAVDQQIAQLNKQLNLPRLLAAMVGTATRNTYCVRSNSKYLEICFHDADKGSARKLTIPDNQVADAPFQVWARSTLFDVKTRAAIQAYAAAKNVIKKFSTASKLAEQAGLTGPSMQSSDVDVVDGWIIFAWNPQKETLALASRETK